MFDQRIRIETGNRTATATNPSGTWSTNATETRWAEAAVISPAKAVTRYDVAFDKQLMWEFRFRDRPSISLRNTRFVWVTNGHDNNLKIYWPRSAPINPDGKGLVTTILVEEDTEETANA